MHVVKKILLFALFSCSLQTASAAMETYENNTKKESSDGFDLVLRNFWLKVGATACVNAMLWAAYKDAEARHYAGATAFTWMIFLAHHLHDESKRLATK